MKRKYAKKNQLKHLIYKVLFEIIDNGLVEDFQITFVKNFTIFIFSTKICKMHLTKLVTYLLLKLNYCLRKSSTKPLSIISNKTCLKFTRQKTLMSIHDGRCYFKQPLDTYFTLSIFIIPLDTYFTLSIFIIPLDTYFTLSIFIN
jgi:hypothetical protein